MNSAGNNSNLFIKLIPYFVILFIPVISAFPQDLRTIDPLTLNSELFSSRREKQAGDQQPAVNFYQTDSIFSFRSPKGYFPSLIHNIGEQASAPFHFRAKQWLYTGAAAGMTTALLCVDGNIDEWARTQKQDHKWVNTISPFITNFGSMYGIYTVAGTGLLSAVFKNEKGVQTSLLATQAMITSGIWAQIIKHLTGRERPEASYRFSHIEGGKWYGPLAKRREASPDNDSGMSFDAFPSGHTATAFSIATVYAMQYKDKKAVPIISYSLASLVGISRLTEHEHWSSDVFVGALLGYLSGRQVVQHFNKTHQNSSIIPGSSRKVKSQITLIQDRNQIGFSLIW